MNTPTKLQEEEKSIQNNKQKMKKKHRKGKESNKELDERNLKK